MSKKKNKDGIYYNGIPCVSGDTVVFMTEIKDGKIWRINKIGQHRTSGPESRILRKLRRERTR